MNTIVNWSFSKLLKYESCPFRVKLQYIERLPEPPLPENNPLERGNRIHNQLERVVKGEGSLHGCEAREIAAFIPMLETLSELHRIGQATAEQDWFFDADWNICEKKDYWLWLKLDYNAFSEEQAFSVVGDWKSGKSAYKTVEHIQQTQLYAGCTALRQEWADKIVTEIPYVDEGHLKSWEYTREDALRFIGRFQQRADRMMADKFFRANPNKQTCRYCPYSPRGTGACPVGV